MAFKIYKTSDSDELSEFSFEYLPKDVISIAYNYRSHGYDGNGFLVAMSIDGLVYAYGLNHCSCYDPISSSSHDKYKIEDLKEKLSKEFYEGIEKLIPYL